MLMCVSLMSNINVIGGYIERQLCGTVTVNFMAASFFGWHAHQGLGLDVGDHAVHRVYPSGIVAGSCWRQRLYLIGHHPELRPGREQVTEGGENLLRPALLLPLGLDWLGLGRLVNEVAVGGGRPRAPLHLR